MLIPQHENVLQIADCKIPQMDRNHFCAAFIADVFASETISI